MEIPLNIFIFLLGLVLLILSSDWLIQAGLKISYIFKLAPLFIGLVLIAFGTSVPEAGIGIVAAIRGQKAIALGNILGSNIANIGLILGICALLRPLNVASRSIFKRELPIMIFAVVLLYILCIDLVISRLDGLVLLLSFVGFCHISYKRAKNSSDYKETEDVELKKVIQNTSSRPLIFLIIALCVLGVFAGANLMVTGGVGVAKLFGISPWIIGITLFAVGTSLPELATSITAAIKKVPSISVGNIVGSNIFNILFTLGVVSLIRPIALEASILRFELPAVLLFSLALLIVMKTAYRITRVEGLVILLGYIAFIILLIK